MFLRFRLHKKGHSIKMYVSISQTRSRNRLISSDTKLRVPRNVNDA